MGAHPALRTRSTTCESIDRSPTGTSGLGKMSVSGRSRVPSPAARIIADAISGGSLTRRFLARPLLGVVAKDEMRARAHVILGVVAVCGVVVCGVIACGNAVGTDACQSIEHARCKWIVQCYADASNY